MRQVTNGDTVRVHYTGTFDDGSQFDSSAGREPIEVTIGTGQVIPGFENALVGMAEGDAKSVTLEPEHAYGDSDDRLVQVVERTRIPAEIDLDVGGVLQASDSAGNPMRLTVVEFDDDSVTLDANHPLAGKTLTFELQLVGFVGS
jgi:peptidylprolyl isomerase